MPRTRSALINVTSVVRYVLQAPVASFDSLFNAVEATMLRCGVGSNRRALRDVEHADVTVNLRSIIAWADAVETPKPGESVPDATADALIQIHAACLTRYRSSGYSPKKPDAPEAVDDDGERGSALV